MKIYKQYKLLKDTPELPMGTLLHWDLWQEIYTELTYIGLRDKPKVKYKKDFLDSNPDWFEPIGEAEELYKKFPDDFSEEHFYFGELRHNKICRFCYDAQEILESKEFRKRVTEVFKELYIEKLKKTYGDHHLINQGGI